MAYTQSPGKMNTPKTGAGIPSVLLQEIPTKKILIYQKKSKSF
jgi:hypothetical protein